MPYERRRALGPMLSRAWAWLARLGTERREPEHLREIRRHGDTLRQRWPQQQALEAAAEHCLDELAQSTERGLRGR